MATQLGSFISKDDSAMLISLVILSSCARSLLLYKPKYINKSKFNQLNKICSIKSGNKKNYSSFEPDILPSTLFFILFKIS